MSDKASQDNGKGQDKPDRLTSDARDRLDALATPNRRRMLMMGAAATSSIVSVKPAMAQAQVSILNCDIPVPGPHGAGQYLDSEGNLVPADTPGAIAPPNRNYSGEQVKRAMNGGWLEGAPDAEANRAYLKYINKLQPGQSGFTCFVSIMNGG